jgi:urease accessory protein UreE
MVENHLSRLASQHQLAPICWVLGRRDTPLRMMRHVVKVQSQALDEHYLDRINSEAWLKHFEDEMHNVEAL